MSTAAHKLSEKVSAESNEVIRVRGCRVHNLRNIDVDIPHNALTVVTGVSGSGKSSLAFDTLYAEGQRRYVESMSAYARQFLERMEKPEADEITGIAPAIAIRQKNTTRNPRSTVATATEIYDYLRLLFARAGYTECPRCGAEVQRDSVDMVAARLIALAEQHGEAGSLRAYLLFPLEKVQHKETASNPVKGSIDTPSKEDALKTRLFELRQSGFNRLWQSGKIFEFSTPESLLEIDFTQPVWVLADRLAVSAESRQRLVDGIELCYRHGGEAVLEFPQSADGVNENIPPQLSFNERFECKNCGIPFEEPEPRLFSFNSPYGACPRCQGFGNTVDFDPDLVVPDPTLALEDGVVEPWTKPRYRRFYNEFRKSATLRGVRLNVPFYQLTDEEKQFVWEGRAQGVRGYKGFVGVRGFFNYLERKKYKLHVRVFLSRYRGYSVCGDCKGGRLRPEAYCIKVGGKDIRAVCRMNIEEVQQFFSALRFSPAQATIAEKILHEIQQRVRFLINVGLGYLTLDRLAATLSGGEAQRIQLATALGAHLVGTFYVLDEPSIGLHSRDTARLIEILKELRDQGNTILVVEHDAAMMETADHIIDLGPGAGENGGKVQFSGGYDNLISGNATLTAKYLKGDFRISLPARRRAVTQKQIRMSGAFLHNLKNIDVTIPLDMMVAITGVSGSGKSTLVHDVLHGALRSHQPEPQAEASEEIPALGRKLGCRKIEGSQHIKNVVLADQSPIGRTPRSNPVTYIKAFDPIRSLFAAQPDSKKRGFAPGHFSFNIPGGRCETCQGNGTVSVEMQFLADVELICEDCNGTRFKSGVLEVCFRGKNIHEVLQLTVREALAFFQSNAQITRRLQVLDDVGLGYLRLGQSAVTLSGGEAQRVKLAGHLAFGSSESTLYIFDEPTTGLHFDDTKKLLAAFARLLENGGSLIIIEHNPDVIKMADWVIDLGPEGGDRGGEIVCCGTPEEVAKCPASHTGKYLHEVLDRHRQWGEVSRAAPSKRPARARKKRLP
ncbi:MAG: excinuclease ABC subunit A [Acidobacteria bacterium RIFCSPLOWO2_12_FULL_54_10]|nr:MAG: excinuclease ABC subunit A [Acidobacteria bacterium RIFCSPLOWO2_12_FULL_54_10]